MEASSSKFGGWRFGWDESRVFENEFRLQTPDSRLVSVAPTIGGSAIAGLNRVSYNMLPPGARRKWRPGSL